MKIIVHGAGPQRFGAGLEDLLEDRHEIVLLPGGPPASEADRRQFATADIIVGIRLTKDMPRPDAVRLYHSAGAGYNGIDTDLLPAKAALCNCYGHERAIAEYVMAAILAHHIPIARADRDLRAGRWEYGGMSPLRLRGEVGSGSIGILGYGHIGRAVARLAKAFGMQVTALSRRPVDAEPDVDRGFGPDELHAFMGSADAIVIAAPLTPETEGMIDASALAAMRHDALLINVARGALVEEQALYDALRAKKIGGAVIDTWYIYPDPQQSHCLPSNLPFHELDNVVMTPHMSGWTRELVDRRRQTIADNINNLVAGRPLINVVRAAEG